MPKIFINIFFAIAFLVLSVNASAANVAVEYKSNFEKFSDDGLYIFGGADKSLYPKKQVGPFSTAQETCDAVANSLWPYVQSSRGLWYYRIIDNGYNFFVRIAEYSSGDTYIVYRYDFESSSLYPSESSQQNLRCKVVFKTSDNFPPPLEGHTVGDYTPRYVFDLALVASCPYGFKMNSAKTECEDEEVPPGCKSGAGGMVTCPPNPPISDNPTSEKQNLGNPLATDIGEGVHPSDFGICRASQAVDSIGDPIQAGTGNMFLREVDYLSPMGLSVIRYYNSATGIWSHNYAISIALNEAGNVANVVRGDGKILTFVGDGLGPWSSNVTVVEKLTKLQSSGPRTPAWQLINEDDGIELYDNTGLPISATAPSGKFIKFNFDYRNLLESVENTYGSKIIFNYARNFSNDRFYLESFRAPDGGGVVYGGLQNNKLTYLRSLPGGVTKYYVYNKPGFPSLLTNTLDENYTPYQNWIYDDLGRATGSFQGVDSNTVNLSYDSSTVAVTDANGAKRHLQFSNVSGRFQFAGQDVPCKDCSGDAASRLIDPSTGLAKETVNHIGSRTVTEFDEARRLPLSITEGAGQSEQRITKITWHPTYRVPVRIEKPGQTTAYTYDSFRNVLSETVTDTQSGVSRTWSWTYDNFGNPITFTDPRNTVTKYIYNDKGLLAQETNAAGHVKKYIEYDANGNLLKSIDPNGVLSEYSYNTEWKLIEVSVAGEKTTIARDREGKITKIINPDASWVSYEYDLARRRTAISDNFGNRIDFTLDNAGNQIREVTKDPNGALAGVLERTVDALGRTQKILGR